MFDLSKLTTPQLHVLRQVAQARVHADDCPNLTLAIVCSIDACLIAHAGTPVDNSLQVAWNGELAAALKAACALQTQIENLGENEIAATVNQEIVAPLIATSMKNHDHGALSAFLKIVTTRHGPDVVNKALQIHNAKKPPTIQ